ncbi:hypothetical protein SMKI_11G2310 [Saccharomyces mikatae IFO 1815]|uniref:TRIP4/RQT4 C2HC5-type zinc finger domain-containing protein n=1 Tax=Saccharomyces mikatae IFO 1815 TaxID=226126 RepID=A0AA35IQ08_SACMI|nr:uncharacterized protein SMKI_11G2310 [Saccharomyces mikatae IFO 1815]CAI4034781.1 hypothetical protein SMKI_11G2310 [Saccharomyces mikatae IFO 1815]
MTRQQAIDYAVKKVPQILPLEESDVKALCEQVLSTSSSNPEQIASKFLEFLGHEDLSFEFVMMFNELLDQSDKKEERKTKPVHMEQTVPIASKNAPKHLTNKHINDSRDKQPKNIKEERKSSAMKSAVHSSDQSKQSQSRKEKKVPKSREKLQSLQEIDDAIKMLELRDSDSSKTCNCQGTRHPVFDVAPNCLYCGKVVCVIEGLNRGKCGHCHKPLISDDERMQMVKILNHEKNELNDPSSSSSNVSNSTNVPKKKTKNYKITSGMGKNLFAEQDKLFDFIERKRERERKRNEVLKLQEKQEVDKKYEDKLEEQGDTVTENPELLAAQERLDRLLHFQDTSAERTKIIDNASDFDMNQEAGLWGSTRERALALKKQQRNLRKWEKVERERNGRREKYVVSMNIGSNGKVTMTEVPKETDNVIADSDDDINDISDEEDISDLKHIHALKTEINRTKTMEHSNLQSKTWDYERDKKQFDRPTYVKRSTDAVQPTSKREGKNKGYDLKSRVQVDQNADASVEQNILAVL